MRSHEKSGFIPAFADPLSLPARSRKTRPVTRLAFKVVASQLNYLDIAKALAGIDLHSIGTSQTRRPRSHEPLPEDVKRRISSAFTCGINLETTKAAMLGYQVGQKCQ